MTTRFLVESSSPDRAATCATMVRNRRISAVSLSIFVLLNFVAFAQTVLPRQNPKTVMEQFCKAEAGGEQLKSDGWREMSRLLVASTDQPRLDEMAVIRDFTVGEPIVDGDKAKITVEYTTLGILDARNLSFGPRGPYPVEPEKIKFERTLILTSRYVQVAPNGVKKEIVGSPEWRIDGQAEAHISVRAAIRYLQELRMKARTDILKKSADESIAVLKQLQ